jgi:purine-binding chemotaxis protein CheW
VKQMKPAEITDSKQFLIFRLAKEEYGVDIRTVTTIIENDMPITRVPRTPDYIKGVINLRGEIVPILDLRKKFNLPDAETTSEARIIIVKIDDMAIGFIVDSVAEVIQLAEESIETVSNFSSDLSLDYISGVGKVDGRIVTLLNLEKLIKT